MKRYKDNKRLEGKKILIVEDYSQIMSLMSEILSFAGAEVMQAANGIECVEMVKYESHDLIVMDIYLPGMNGIDAYKNVKKSKGATCSPVLFVSSDHVILEKRAKESLPGEAFLQKPFKPIEFLEKAVSIVSTPKGR